MRATIVAARQRGAPLSQRLLAWIAAGVAAITAAFVLTRLGAAPDAVVLRPLRDQALVIPCSPGDATRAVHEVAGVGRFCIEREGVDVIKSVIRRGEPWEPYLAPVFRAHARPGTARRSGRSWMAWTTCCRRSMAARTTSWRCLRPDREGAHGGRANW